LIKEVKTKALFDCQTPYLTSLFAESEYPWDMLPKIKELARKLISEGIEGYTLIADGVLVGENVKIYPTATIEGPTVIGSGTEVRPGAFIRGGVITGENCVIGNSSELKNCILLNKVQIPHYNYVGDSILGYKSHMGAGAIASNFRLDHANIIIKDGDCRIETGLRKLGVLLGDFAEVGCGSVLSPGTVIGRKTIVYPLSHVTGVITGGQIFNNGKIKPRIDIKE
jgi:NDP-sugar pyrophosphorylase family protein